MLGSDSVAAEKMRSILSSERYNLTIACIAPNSIKFLVPIETSCELHHLNIIIAFVVSNRFAHD